MTTPTHYYLPREITGIESLLDLALDLRWSWNHAADELWGQIEPELWDLTNNPWVVLQTASRTKLKALAADRTFREQVEDHVRTTDDALKGMSAVAGADLMHRGLRLNLHGDHDGTVIILEHTE